MKNLSFKSLVDALMYFPDDKVCKEYLEQQRWNGDISCMYCGHDEKIYRLKNGFKCSECKKKFTVLKGTIFEKSQLPLQKWFGAIWLITSHKKGISSLQLSKDIGVTQKTAWFMLQRIRNAFSTDTFDETLSNIVEVDETYVGGKSKNKHASKRTPGTQGRNTKDKAAVFGMLQRSGRMVTMKVTNVTSDVLQSIIENTVDRSSHVMSDEWRAYNGLENKYKHSRVNHGAGNYVFEEVHTNTIESFWSVLKRGIIGIYHSVSKFHLDRYLSEFEFRHNYRKMTDSEKFDKLLAICNSRTTYEDLIQRNN